MKIKVVDDRWKPVYRPFTDGEKEKLREFELQYYLEVERARIERLTGLSKMPRNRLLD